MRYEGTDCALMVTAAGYPRNAQSCRAGDFHSAFTKRYLKEFGFTIPDRPIVVDDIRVRGCGKSGIKLVNKSKMGSGQAKPVTVTKCYFEDGYLDTSVYLWEELPCGHILLIDNNMKNQLLILIHEFFSDSDMLRDVTLSEDIFLH